MSVEDQIHVALSTAESEVKQPRPGLDVASDSESVGEVIVSENKFEPISQANFLDAGTKNERFVPAAVEQSHNAYSRQASVCEDGVDFEERNWEFDAFACFNGTSTGEGECCVRDRQRRYRLRRELPG